MTLSRQQYSRSSLNSRIAAAREFTGARYGRCRTVLLPAGSFLLGLEPLDVWGAHGLVLEGAGPDATELVITSDMPTGVLFRDCIRSGLRNLTVRAAARCGSLVRFGRWTTRENQAALGLPSATQCVLGDVVLNCGAFMNAGVQDAYAGIGAELSGPVNENNDCHTFTRVEAHSYRTAAIFIAGNQSKGHRFVALECSGNGFGKTAVWSQGGGFRAVGCNSAGHTWADIVLADTGDSVTLVGWHGETSRRFVDQPNRTGVPMAVVLEGCEWMADQLHGDGDAVRINGPGPLTVLGGHYGSGKQDAPHFRMDPFVDEPCAFTCVGATFGVFGAAQAPVPPFRLPALCDRDIHGNLFADGRLKREGMAVFRPEWNLGRLAR